MKIIYIYIFIVTLFISGVSSVFSQNIDKNKDVGEISLTQQVSNTGAVVYNVPIDIYTGINNMQPSVSLGYNSFSGNGVVGVGWNIGGLSSISITNSTVYYDGKSQGAQVSSSIYMLDGIRLLSSGNDFETEQGNILVKNKNNYFEVSYPDGKKAIYGFPAIEGRKILYPLTRIEDSFGNFIEYEYLEDNNIYYVSSIKYGGNSISKSEHIASVKFFYNSRQDIIPIYIDGLCQKQTKLLDRIETYYTTSLLRTYKLDYDGGDYMRLKQINCTSESKSLNPLIFDYGTGQQKSIEKKEYTKDESINYKGTYAKFDITSPYTGLVLAGGYHSSIYTATGTDSGKIVQYGSNYEPNANAAIKVKGVNDVSHYVKIDNYFQGLLPIDYDGDGNDELIKINNASKESSVNVNFIKYKYVNNPQSGGGFSPTSFSLSTSSQDIKIEGYKSPEMRTYLVGNFDGTGKALLLIIAYGENIKGETRNTYATFVDVENQKIKSENSSFFTIKPGDIISPFDFDGDGKSELCHITSSGVAYIYNVDPTDGSFREIARKGILFESNFNVYDVKFADINADGKTDILCSSRLSVKGKRYVHDGPCAGCCSLMATSPEELEKFGDFPAIMQCGPDKKCVVSGVESYHSYDGGTDWTAYYSNGKDGFISTTMTNIGRNYNRKGNERPTALQDINQDGLPDLIRTDDNNNVYIHLNENGVLNSKPYYSTQINENYFNIVSGDLIKQNFYNQVLLIYENRVTALTELYNETQQRLLTSSTNSLGVSMKHTYEYITNEVLYKKSQTPVYPYMSLTSKTFLPQTTKVYDSGSSMISSERYIYSDGVIHRLGLGFKGFRKISVKNEITGITTEQTFDPEKFGVQIGADSPITSSTSTYSISIAANKIAKVLLASAIEKDKLNDNTITSSYTYDSYGNRIGEIVDYGNSIKVTTSNQYNNYTGTVYKLGELVSQEIKSERDSKSVKTKTLISYNTNYLPTSKKTYYDDKLTSEEAYYYNSKFQLDSLRTKAYSSPNWLSTKYTYDAYGRIATETDALGLKITNTYNTKGLLASVKNHKGHETKYEYDAWGRKKKTIFPDGTIETTTLEWAKTDSELGTLDPNKNSGTLKINTSPPSGTITACESIILQPGFSYTSASGSLLLNIEPNTCATVPTTSGVSTSYLVTTIAMGAPTTKVYYDALGREVRKGEVRFDGKYLYTDYIYNNKGQLQKTSLPFKGSAPTLWNEYSYDSYDRIISLAYASGKKDTYSYAKNKVTSLVDGISTTKTYNAAGELISVTDAAGTITYTLRADGQPNSITAPGNVTTSFEYDAYGRQTKIIDPSAGTKTFAYDIAGNIAKETDANNKSINYTYDKYNRLIKKEIVGEQTISSVYNSDGLLTSETSTNNTSKTYTYDNLLRVSTQRETVVDGKWLEKQYAYSGGNTVSTLYTSQSGTIATENYSYSYGHLSEIKLNNSTSIWKLTAENSLGMASQAITGGLTRTYGYNAYGLPSMRSTTNGGALIQVFTYEFDAKTGNLIWRKDNTRNLQENFTYDNLNRLVSFGGNTITYDVKGNITNHTGVGKFEYLRTDKPYAITDVTPYGNAIPLRNQTITYNAQMRPLSITENNYVATFAYNSGGDRVKMHIKKNNIAELVRYYIGAQYEIDGGVAGDKERLYLGGDAYSAAAVYVKEAGKWNIYYICRDYLGSITHITDATGVVKQELSYDAWGRLRNPVDQKLYAEGTEPVLLLGRGYTGHEHLQMFGLINMNARLYDPVIGRFLSPDPYVQAPDWSQNFNRYSYCVNNPLRYSDLTGEWFGVDDAIAAFIGGVVNVVVNIPNITSFQHGATLFVVGAVGGWASLYVTPVVGGAFIGGANSITNQGFTVGPNNISWSNVALDTFMGGLTAGVGSKLSGMAGPVVEKFTSKIASPALKGAAIGALMGTGTGFVISGGLALGRGESLEDAFSEGLKGALNGAGIGAITGMGIGFRQAYKNGQDAWTGNYKLDRAPLPDNVFSSKAVVEGNTPGKTEMSGVYVNDKGVPQPWNAKYDQYGRLIERTDFNAGNRTHNIPSTHYHTKDYLPKGQIYRQDHLPGIGPRTNWQNSYYLKLK